MHPSDGVPFLEGNPNSHEGRCRLPTRLRGWFDQDQILGPALAPGRCPVFERCPAMATGAIFARSNITPPA